MLRAFWIACCSCAPAPSWGKHLMHGWVDVHRLGRTKEYVYGIMIRLTFMLLPSIGMYVARALSSWARGYGRRHPGQGQDRAFGNIGAATCSGHGRYWWQPHSGAQCMAEVERTI